AINRILERSSVIDILQYGDGGSSIQQARRSFGPNIEIHDLRIFPIALQMVRSWTRHLPWLYYRDLWIQPRGQWLATFLGLGVMRCYRPVLRLADEDRLIARALPSPYIVLAPHIGTYGTPFGKVWRRIKGWELQNWEALARELHRQGYEVITLSAAGQEPVAGTRSIAGLPILQAAGVVQRSAGLVTGESGMWFVAAALDTRFIIVPWWLPRSVSWPAHMNVPHRLIYRDRASVQTVHDALMGLVSHDV
ncbi:MAG: glycosyltransferase family 9 protein, partial [Chloroflexota bacterium]